METKFLLGEKQLPTHWFLFGLSGHGQLDMAAYDAYLSGHLEDFEYPEEKIRESLKRLPKVAF